MKYVALSALLLSICVWIACKKSNTGCKPPEPIYLCGTTDNFNTSCDSVFCTMNIVSINVDVLDAAGNPVILDSFYTTDTNGKMPNVLYGNNGNAGSYMIFNDSWVSGHQKTLQRVKFIGFKNGLKIVDEPYSIYTDCCHVSRTAGKAQIIIP